MIAWLQAAREEFEVKDARSAPPNRANARTRVNALMGGGPIARCLQRAFFRTPYGAVLEFEFLSRKMVAEQSMGTWRWASAVSLLSELEHSPLKTTHNLRVQDS